MNSCDLVYEADGLTMSAYFVAPDDLPRPGVLVFPDAGGLGDQAKHRADRIAQEFGYAALACDYWGDGRQPADMNEVAGLLGQVRGNRDRVRARTLPALAALAARPEVDAGRIAAIGFCFGGTLAFELACAGTDLRAAIGFHSGLRLSAPEDGHRSKAAILAMIGADDPSISPDDRLAFEGYFKGGTVDWQLLLFGGVVHSFTSENADKMGRPEFARYDKRADERSWRLLGDFLRETL